MGHTVDSEKRSDVAMSIFRAKEMGVFIPLVVLVIALAFLAQNFLTQDNIFSVLRAVSFEGIVSIGMLIVMLTAGLDLSVASNMAFTGILASILMTNGIPTFPAIILSLVGSACVGLVNGFLINKVKLGAIIVTLGMLSVVRGLAYIITKGPGSISERAVPLDLAKNYDPEYYVHNQVIPAALRVLAGLGYTEDDILRKKPQASLDKFIQKGLRHRLRTGIKKISRKDQ